MSDQPVAADASGADSQLSPEQLVRIGAYGAIAGRAVLAFLSGTHAAARDALLDEFRRLNLEPQEKLLAYAAACVKFAPECATQGWGRRTTHKALFWLADLSFESLDERAVVLHLAAKGAIGQSEHALALALFLYERQIRRRLPEDATASVAMLTQIAVSFDNVARKGSAERILQQAARICERAQVAAGTAMLAYRLLAACQALRKRPYAAMTSLARAETYDTYTEPLQRYRVLQAWVTAIGNQAVFMDLLPVTLMAVYYLAQENLAEPASRAELVSRLHSTGVNVQRTRNKHLGVLAAWAALRIATEGETKRLPVEEELVLLNNFGVALVDAELEEAARAAYAMAIQRASRSLLFSIRPSTRDSRFHQLVYAWTGIGNSHVNEGNRAGADIDRHYRLAVEAYDRAGAALARCRTRRFEHGRMWASKGDCLARLGDADRAHDAFARALLAARRYWTPTTLGNQIEENFAFAMIAGLDGRTLDVVAAIRAGGDGLESVSDTVALLLNPESKVRSDYAGALFNMGALHAAIVFSKLAVRAVHREGLPHIAGRTAQLYVHSRSDTHRLLIMLLTSFGRLNEAEQAWILFKHRQYQQVADAGEDDEARDDTDRNGTVLDEESGVALGEQDAELAVALRASEQQALIDAGLYGALIAAVRDQGTEETQVQQVAMSLRRLDECLQSALKRRADELAGQADAGRAIADASHAVIRYTVRESSLSILVRTIDGAHHTEVPCLMRTLAERAIQLRSVCRKSEAGSLEDLKPVAEELYRFLIAPIDSHIGPAVTDLFLQLDDPLQTVPFAALYDGSRFLVERFSLAIVTASVVPGMPRGSDTWDGPVSAAVFGCGQIDGMHLPGVRPELNEVSTALNEREAGSLVSTYEDSACTSAALLHELAKPPTGPSLVHIATHATFNATRPGLCVLALADGGLSVPTLRRALGGAPIDLDLFVLSACGTARQDHDVEGFAVTLLSRGVRGVIATLWESLDLSAPRLFGAFYRELRGAPAITGAARALQFAQREMLTSTDLVDGLPLSHPAHWATYVLVTSRYPSDPVT